MVLLLLVYLAAGAFAGWLAGATSKYGGFGRAWNAAVGLLGGLAGTALVEAIGTHPILGFLAIIFGVFVGAALLFTRFGPLRRSRT